MYAMESQELMDQQFEASVVNEKKEKDCKCWQFEDFEWQLQTKKYYNAQHGTRNHVYWTPALIAGKHLKRFKKEIEAAGFYVNDIDHQEVLLAELDDYVILYVNRQCIKNFLAKFPTLQDK